MSVFATMMFFGIRSMPKRPIIGIRREDKNAWERRTPLVPKDVRRLVHRGISVWVESSSKRAFSDSEFEDAGAQIKKTLKGCPVIFGVKEIPVKNLEHGKTYIFFSHTVKGQPGGMPLLKRLLDLKCQLIDYEKVVGDNGRRLIFFGKFAGIAGMIDSLWALGRRLQDEGISSPFTVIKPAHQYASLDEALEEIFWAGKLIEKDGLPEEITPFVCGFSGRGNVSRGAQIVFNELPVEILTEDSLAEGRVPRSKKKVYKWVFSLNHLMQPSAREREFSYNDYHQHPEKYRGALAGHLPKFTIFMNGIFWNPRYPRLITRDMLKRLYRSPENPRLRVIGDVTCDVNGSVECNVKSTDSANPVYVYNPRTGKARDGIRGKGPVVMAVDNLPCELPRESSAEFSSYLYPFVAEIAKANFGRKLDKTGLSPTIRRAVVVQGGRLTHDFDYLSKFILQKRRPVTKPRPDQAQSRPNRRKPALERK